jgi:predicted RNA-binding Zn-ribbon protein involved in translation (DUF1610 family)
VFLFGGKKTKATPVKGGRSGARVCEGCRATVTFYECEVTDKVHAFFVELFEATTRRMVCPECGEDHDVEEFFEAARRQASLARPAPQRAPAPSRSASSREREAEIDEELAALKRKIASKK